MITITSTDELRRLRKAEAVAEDAIDKVLQLQHAAARLRIAAHELRMSL